MKAESAEKAIRYQPIHGSGAPMSSVTRRRPKSPALWITPDMSAETWAGAAAWARGSQVWNGKKADLSPKEVTRRTKVTFRSWLGWRRKRSKDWKSIEPTWLWITMNAARRKKRPTCVETR